MNKIIPNFKIWSNKSKEIKQELSPLFKGKKFTDLTNRDVLWKILKPNLYQDQNDIFRYSEDILFSNLILYSVYILNKNNKFNSYGKNLLESTSSSDISLSTKNIKLAKLDFQSIMLFESDNVVLELLSHYFNLYLNNITNYLNINYKIREGQKEKDFEKRKRNEISIVFDKIAEDLNDTFTQFSLDYTLTLQGFMPKNDKKIIEKISEPVLKMLSDNKWKEVNKLMSDSFLAHNKNREQGYSESITNAVAALEAYLQILIYGKTGGKSLGALVSEAIKVGKIPDDNLSRSMINPLTSFLAKERKETGIAHPKKEYANEKNSRLMQNIVMIFIQHSSNQR